MEAPKSCELVKIDWNEVDSLSINAASAERTMVLIRRKLQELRPEDVIANCCESEVIMTHGAKIDGQLLPCIIPTGRRAITIIYKEA